MKIIIVGGGQAGEHIAAKLLSGGHQVVIIEQRKERYDKLVQQFGAKMLLLESGTDPEVLKRAGIMQVDVVASVTGEDEVNLVVSTLAKMEFGVPKVVARVNNPKNAWLFDSSMGVDYPVNQAALLTKVIVEEDILENIN